MSTTDKKRFNQLIKEIQKHDYLYYVLDDPSIRDEEYDRLFKELQKLESKYPKWVTPSSPTQRVPGEALDCFEKIPHKQKMLSLDNSYSSEEVFKFVEKISSSIKKKSINYFCEPKLDGVAVELVYEKGELKWALTRGDGSIGENVLENIKTIKSIPLFLNTPSPPSIFEARGEVMLFKKEFKKLNQEQIRKNEKIFANPRNAAAGTLRNLNPQIAHQRNLRIFCYGFGVIQDLKIHRQHQFFDVLKKFQIPCFSYQAFDQWNHSQFQDLSKPLCVICKKGEDIISYYNTFLKWRDKLPFETDGIVIKVDSIDDQKKLGSIARSPRWATSFKFPAESKITQINDVFWQLGRTGVVTPVAKLQGVNISGVVVTQATLHNQGEIQKKDIRIKDFVEIRRAGDVIPEVKKVILSKRPRDTRSLKIPRVCPHCRQVLQKQNDLLYCVNSQCAHILVRKLQHFCSKSAMDIRALGEKIIFSLFEEKLIKNFSDIYRLKKKDLEKLPGFADKSSDNIISNIQSSKKCRLAQFLMALGIRHVGEQMAINLADHFGSSREGFNKISKASEEELMNIDGVGKVAAQSIIQELVQMRSEIKKLFELGVHIINSKINLSQKLKNLRFVITGQLPESRKNVSEQIRNHGGKISSSVSAQTDYLLCGENPGSKYNQAQKLKIKILNFEKFKALIK